MRQLGYIILLLCLLMLSVKAQDFRADWEKIRSVGKEQGSLGFKIEYAIYPSHTSTHVLSQQGCQYYVANGYYYMVFPGLLEYLYRNGIMVVVDHEDQTLMAGHLDVEKARGRMLVHKHDYLSLLDSMIAVSEAEISPIPSTPQGQRGYRIALPHSQFLYIELYFRTEDYLVVLNKLYYRYPLYEEEGLDVFPPRIEVAYSAFDRTISAENPIFYLGNFLVLNKDGQYQPQPKYADYTFVDQLNK